MMSSLLDALIRLRVCAHIQVNGQSVLKNVEMRIPAGSLTAIVGKVGAGKSSLLSALLGGWLPLLW